MEMSKYEENRNNALIFIHVQFPKFLKNYVYSFDNTRIYTTNLPTGSIRLRTILGKGPNSLKQYNDLIRITDGIENFTYTYRDDLLTLIEEILPDSETEYDEFLNKYLKIFETEVGFRTFTLPNFETDVNNKFDIENILKDIYFRRKDIINLNSKFIELTIPQEMYARITLESLWR